MVRCCTIWDSESECNNEKEHKKKEERLRRWDLVKDILRTS